MLPIGEMCGQHGPGLKPDDANGRGKVKPGMDQLTLLKFSNVPSPDNSTLSVVPARCVTGFMT